MKKIVKRIISYIKNDKLLFIIWFVGCFVSLLPLPYYVVAPGGIKDISSRIEIKDYKIKEKTFHTTYIKEYKGRIPILVYAFFNKDYDIVKKSDMTLEFEDYQDDLKRGKLYLEESFDNALISSFKLSNNNYSILSSKLFILYTEESVSEKLNIGDQIINIENKKIVSVEDIEDIIANYNVGDEISIDIIRDKKEMTVKTKIIDIEGEKKVGIFLIKDSEIKSEPEVSMNSGKNEYGPSGGLMTSLSMYYTIMGIDLNLKIAGTGTINEDSTVGEIGGIDKKIIAAAKEKLDIFFCPAGDNYDLAMKIKDEKNLKINIVGVSTLKEAIDYISGFLNN